MGVPLNHPFFGSSLEKNHPSLAPCMDTPIFFGPSYALLKNATFSLNETITTLVEASRAPWTWCHASEMEAQASRRFEAANIKRLPQDPRSSKIQVFMVDVFSIVTNKHHQILQDPVILSNTLGPSKSTCLAFSHVQGQLPGACNETRRAPWRAPKEIPTKQQWYVVIISLYAIIVYYVVVLIITCHYSCSYITWGPGVRDES